MKKTMLLIIALMLMFGSFATLSADTADKKESDIYYINAKILKIFPHKLGYYVIYRRGGLKTAQAFIPHEWFDRRDSRAVLNLTDGNIDPYLTFVMRNGEFDHVRVAAKKNLRHNTWGTIAENAIPADRFQIETLAPEF
ncbi:MAG TPA: hypothetical protein GXZ47_01565 [Treponema sp.]|nr:hypothetical protein [Treponema sp.]